jgi:hypothetical protein
MALKHSKEHRLYDRLYPREFVKRNVVYLFLCAYLRSTCHTNLHILYGITVDNSTVFSNVTPCSLVEEESTAYIFRVEKQAEQAVYRNPDSHGARLAAILNTVVVLLSILSP